MEVQREVVLPEPPDEVWEAVTDPERLEEWLANDVELELEPGGDGVFRWDDGSVRRATVEVVEPGRRFAFTWWDEGAEGDESLVEIALEELDDGTRLTIVEAPVAQVLALAA